MFRIEAILRRVKGKKGKEITSTKSATSPSIPVADSDDRRQKSPSSPPRNRSFEPAVRTCERDFRGNYALKTIRIDDNYFNARSMDVYITKLRKHLKDDPSIEIINIHGKGYKLIAPDVDSKR